MKYKDFLKLVEKFNWKLTSKEKKQERYSICKECPSLKYTVCIECKCLMKFKTSIEQAKCPLEKW